jgi:hypothetical protein
MKSYYLFILAIAFLIVAAGCGRGDGPLPGPEATDALVPTTLVTLDITPSPSPSPTNSPEPEPYPPPPAAPESDPYPYPPPGETQAALTPIVTPPTESTWTATPTVAPVESKPDCEAGPIYTSCQDVILSISFDYPSSWGELTAYQVDEPQDGINYFYRFSNSFPGSEIDIQAGGVSQDYSADKDGILTSFSGFESASETEICDSEIFDHCRQIQPGVFFMIQMPDADGSCEPYPGITYRPLGIVRIDLPENPTIQGFTLAAPFLSPDAQNELDAELSLGPAGYVGCDEDASREAYDQRVEELLQGFLARRLDNTSTRNVEFLIYLGQSIRFIEE